MILNVKVTELKQSSTPVRGENNKMEKKEVTNVTLTSDSLVKPLVLVLENASGLQYGREYSLEFRER